MRDPLHWMPIKYKLPLAFVVLGFLAFGIGGYLVSRFARNALEEEIHHRLEVTSSLCSLALENELILLRSRCEDFASDGLIRGVLEHPAPGDRERLAAHLRRNKVPLVAAFVDCIALDGQGRSFASAGPTTWSGLSEFEGTLSGSRVGPFDTGEGDPVGPSFGIVVPVLSLDGTRPVGRLVLRVRMGRFIHDAIAKAGRAIGLEDDSLELTVGDGAGRHIVVPTWLIRDAASGVAVRSPREDWGLRVEEGKGRAGTPERKPGWFFSESRLTNAGWTAVTSLDAEAALAPVRGLESRYIAAGLATAVVLVGGLSLVVKFLILPLGRMQEMARRMAEGDYRVRVAATSADEIGDLARSFNAMAEAVDERTRRVEAEHRRLEVVVNAMQDGLVLLDGDGRIVISNEAARPLSDILKGRFGVVAQKECPRHSAPDRCVHCLQDGRNEFQQCVLEIGEKIFEVIETTLPEDVDIPGSRVLVARDITERTIMNELQAQQEGLTVLGEVSAVIAHELNNPLAVISMFNQMMADGLDEDSPFRENVDVIARNTETCKRAVRDILDHICAEGVEVEDLDLEEVLHDVFRFLEPLARKNGVRLELDLPGDGELETAGDIVKLRQVFVNLVLNAIQAFEGREGRIVIRGRREGADIFVDVEDDGPGVDPEHVDKIFEPFFTTKEGGRGTGLGLPTSRRTVRTLGGELSYRPGSQGGACFRVALSVKQSVLGEGAQP